MMRRLSLTIAMWLVLSAGLSAQAADRSRAESAHAHLRRAVQEEGLGRSVVHYGKWLAGVGAVALTWMGAREHARSADAWDDLLALCGADHADCALGADGRYLNPTAEAYYDESVRFDQRARTRLLAGQGALILAVGLFILDIPNGKHGPENIPVAPLEITGNPRTGEAQVGLRLRF